MNQQAHPQYVYVHEGEEEYEEGELYYAPAPPQGPYALFRRPLQPKSMSSRVPNTSTDVTITVKEVAPPPVRHTLARPRPPPAERVVYFSETSQRARIAGPRIYEVGEDGYHVAGDDEFDSCDGQTRPEGRIYIRE